MRSLVYAVCDQQSVGISGYQLIVAGDLWSVVVGHVWSVIGHVWSLIGHV